MHRIFILSPANCNGRRARQAMSPNATFALAQALRSDAGAPLGEFFTFISGLYFRGKLTSARRFAQPPEPANPVVGVGVHVITPNAGLRSPDTLVTHAAVRAFATGDIDVDNRKYRRPLEASARPLLAAIGPARPGAPRRRKRRGLRPRPARRRPVTEVCRRPHRHLRRAAAVPDRVRRPRRHEPRW